MAGAEPTRVVVQVGEPTAVREGARAADVARDARAAVQGLVELARRTVDEV